MEAKVMRKAIGTVPATLAIGLVVLLGAPAPALAEPVGVQPLFYLENKWTGEGMFTIDRAERDAMRDDGWTYEKVSLILPVESESPVYRLFNPYTDDHLFTQDANEYEELGSYGWQQEGVKFYSDDAQRAPMYRIFASWIDGKGSHEYTTNAGYHEQRLADGWQDDGARWYGIRVPVTATEMFQGLSYPDLEYSETGDPILPTTPEVSDGMDGEGRQDVLSYARQYIGYPYVYAGESPAEGGFDCSGLTYWVYGYFGVTLPRTTYGQIQWLKDHGTWTSDITQLEPGDLVAMSGGGHVAIFVGYDAATGDYLMIDAPNPGERVVERSIWSISNVLGGGSVL